MAEEFKILDAGEGRDPSGNEYYVIRYQREDGTDHLHAMPLFALDQWMIEKEYEGTPKQAFPLMLNEMLDQLTPDGVEGPRVILPKDSNHPVHRIHRKVDKITIQKRRDRLKRRTPDAPEHRPSVPAPVRRDGRGVEQHGEDGGPRSRWDRYAPGTSR